MQDISGFGLEVRLVASETYPTGITLTSFADDADPFDIPSLQVRDKAMGLNGDLVHWSKANPVLITLNLIPASDDDKEMEVLVSNNRAERDKRVAKDVITLTGIYPDGRTITLSNGVLTDGSAGKSVASAGRIKTSQYVFAFEKMSKVHKG